uniref:Uncharacterized protein n=1 Tax=Ditylenchus dipsaci TaxID=166011 RepID=A0A915EP62_9BILA
MLLLSNKNDLILTGIYRKELREYNLADYRRNVQNIVNMVNEVMELKKRRNSSLLQLINNNVDIMVEKMEQIVSKIHQIFAQYVPPITITVEESKKNVRSRMEELYALFVEQFHFSIPENYHLKVATFSKDLLNIKLAPVNPEDELLIKALQIQKRNLIQEVEEEEIRTIACEQVPQEEIERLEFAIKEIKANK